MSLSLLLKMINMKFIIILICVFNFINQGAIGCDRCCRMGCRTYRIRRGSLLSLCVCPKQPLILKDASQYRWVYNTDSEDVNQDFTSENVEQRIYWKGIPGTFMLDVKENCVCCKAISTILLFINLNCRYEIEAFGEKRILHKM